MDMVAFAQMLDTFETDDFAPAIEKMKRVLTIEGTSVSRHGHSVPASQLQTIYKRRTLNPYSSPMRRYQNGLLAKIASQFPSERWYIHTVANVRILFTVFANEENVGRVCLDYDV